MQKIHKWSLIYTISHLQNKCQIYEPKYFYSTTDCIVSYLSFCVLLLSVLAALRFKDTWEQSSALTRNDLGRVSHQVRSHKELDGVSSMVHRKK